MLGRFRSLAALWKLLWQDSYLIECPCGTAVIATAKDLEVVDESLPLYLVKCPSIQCGSHLIFNPELRQVIAGYALIKVKQQNQSGLTPEEWRLQVAAEYHQLRVGELPAKSDDTDDHKIIPFNSR